MPASSSASRVGLAGRSAAHSVFAQVGMAFKPEAKEAVEATVEGAEELVKEAEGD